MVKQRDFPWIGTNGSSQRKQPQTRGMQENPEWGLLLAMLLLLPLSHLRNCLRILNVNIKAKKHLYGWLFGKQKMLYWQYKKTSYSKSLWVYLCKWICKCFIRPNRRTDLNMHPKVQKNVLELGSLYSDGSLWFCLDFLAVMLRGQPFLTRISRCISLAALVNVIIMCPLCTVECLACRPSRLLKPSSPVNGLLHPSWGNSRLEEIGGGWWWAGGLEGGRAPSWLTSAAWTT